MTYWYRPSDDIDCCISSILCIDIIMLWYSIILFRDVWNIIIIMLLKYQ